MDSFGNYLCQKLVEVCQEETRTKIVQQVEPQLVEVSLNMHGTRAVQKLVECVDSAEQIECLRRALSGHVVTLIKDLNGNHVIQRCLVNLTHEQKQFIYDSAAEDCVSVSTHRHGCCVMQRCIDHASEDQKMQLVEAIIQHSP